MKMVLKINFLTISTLKNRVNSNKEKIMKIIVYTLSEEEMKNRDYREEVIIEINGHREMMFREGEPEDNSLSRNFSGVFFIDELMKKAYEAGINGEEFSVEQKLIGD